MHRARDNGVHVDVGAGVQVEIRICYIVDVAITRAARAAGFADTSSACRDC